MREEVSMVLDVRIGDRVRALRDFGPVRLGDEAEVIGLGIGLGSRRTVRLRDGRVIEGLYLQSCFWELVPRDPHGPRDDPYWPGRCTRCGDLGPPTETCVEDPRWKYRVERSVGRATKNAEEVKRLRAGRPAPPLPYEPMNGAPFVGIWRKR